MKARKRKLTPLTWLAALVIAIVFLTPLVWMISTAFKTDVAAFSDPGFIPKNPTLENFLAILTPANNEPVLAWLMNSVIVSVVGAAITVVLSSFSGYAYARMEFPGRKAVFSIMIATFLLPGVMFLIPQYVLVSQLGLYNTLAALILPGLASVFGVFFMRQFFLDFPLELEEAAAIEGAGTVRTFISIVVPLSKAPIATLAVISFLGYWNDYLWPLVMCQGAGCTLSAGLANFQGQQTTNYGLLMACAVIAALPILAVFLVAQRWIVQSVAFTGSKS